MLRRSVEGRFGDRVGDFARRSGKAENVQRPRRSREGHEGAGQPPRLNFPAID